MIDAFSALPGFQAAPAITAVTQSSSAGVAAALVALDAGAIGLRQAAVMVVGMNIGTTVTALLATLGGSVAARPTATPTARTRTWCDECGKR